MFSKLGLALVVASTLCSQASQASVANIFDITSSQIMQGGSVTENLTLNITADSGYFNAYFTGGTVTLNGGNGVSSTYSISSGLTSESFSATFAYPNAGGFLPSFSFAANYSEQYQQYGLSTTL